MAFELAKFSTNGLELLSDLSSAKALRIKNIYVDEVQHDQSDLDQPSSWWSSQTSPVMNKINAELDAASKIDTQARLVVKLNLKQDQTSTLHVKTIIITACGVESGIETDEIVLCGVSDNIGIDVIYNPSDIKLSTYVAIYFKFNNASSISFSTDINPDYVIHSELDRFMSCHIVGDVNSGESQVIRGEKVFYDSPVINIYDGQGLVFRYCGDQNGDPSETVYTDQFLIKDSGDTGIVFKSLNLTGADQPCFKFQNDADTIIESTWDGASSYTTTISGTLNADHLNATSIETRNIHVDNQLGIEDHILSVLYNGFCTDGDFIPNTNKTKYLGLPGYQWKSFYTYEAYISGGIYIESTNAVESRLTIYEDEGDLCLGGFTSDKGLQLRPTSSGQRASLSCGKVYSSSITANGDSSITGDLTVSGNITAKSLQGALPVPDSEFDVPVGCICVLSSRETTILQRSDRLKGTYHSGANKVIWTNTRTGAVLNIMIAPFEESDTSTVLDMTSTIFNGATLTVLTHSSTGSRFLVIRES